MTLDELKNSITSDSAVQADFEAAVDAGTLVDWAKSKGVAASEEELISALQLQI